MDAIIRAAAPTVHDHTRRRATPGEVTYSHPIPAR
jgi:hypothetical protein